MKSKCTTKCTNDADKRRAPRLSQLLKAFSAWSKHRAGLMCALFATHVFAAGPATAPQPLDLAPAVFQELPATSATFSRDTWLRQKYVLCYSSAAAAGKTPQWNRVSTLNVVGTNVTCTPPLSEGEPAIAAGKRVIIVVDWPINDAGGHPADCPATSPSEVKLASINIPPTDPYPVRGAPTTPAAQPAAGAQALLEYTQALAVTNTTAQPMKACYLLIPGGLAADTFNTLTVTLPAISGGPVTNVINGNVTRIHTYYRFGVSTAVVLNNIRTNTYAYAAGSTAASGTTPADIKYDTTTSVRTFDPVLFLTWYPKPVDIETKVDWSNPINYDYGVVLGLSEKAPTTNFYLGLSIEPVRNIAIVVGASVISVARISNGTFDPGPSAMHLSPATTNEFKVGGFVGLSFNFSNFLTSTIFK